MRKTNAKPEPKKALTKKRTAGKTSRAVKKKSLPRQGRTTAPGQTKLQIGQPAPDFTLPNDEGQLVSLADFRGQNVVLFFYPEDDTPTCTQEACSFRDGLSAILQRRAVVLGVSADSIVSHSKFKEKFHLNFPLLSDVDRTVCNAYGVWQKKQMFGHRFWGIVRTTFIINENGLIKKIFPRVRVNKHYERVLAAL